jgi:mRNA interferase MazF
MNRGDIYLCDFGDPIGHEPALRRPALVVSPLALNRHGTPVVLPISRRPRGYPTHIELDGPLPVISYVQCELVRAVSIQRFIRLLAAVDATVMTQVEAALRRVLGL